MSQTIAEHLMEQGAKLGERRGEQRGEQRGEMRAKREDVLRLMLFRFDAIPASVEKKIKSIRSIDRLNALFEKALRAESLSEIERNILNNTNH